MTATVTRLPQPPRLTLTDEALNDLHTALHLARIGIEHQIVEYQQELANCEQKLADPTLSADNRRSYEGLVKQWQGHVEIQQKNLATVLRALQVAYQALVVAALRQRS